MEEFFIPIDFCPKCKNKKIRVIQGKTFECEYSLSGRCLKKSRFPETTYTLLHCTKCGWTSGSWNEAGYEDYKEFQELEELYRKENE